MAEHSCCSVRNTNTEVCPTTKALKSAPRAGVSKPIKTTLNQDKRFISSPIQGGKPLAFRSRPGKKFAWGRRHVRARLHLGADLVQ